MHDCYGKANHMQSLFSQKDSKKDGLKKHYPDGCHFQYGQSMLGTQSACMPKFWLTQ